MNFLKSAHSLIFKMLKNAGKSRKLLFTLIIPRALNFTEFPEICFKDDLRAFLLCAGFSNSFSWARSLSCLSCSRFTFGFIGWTRDSLACWANAFSLSCRRRRRLCCSKKKKKKKKATAPSHIWTDDETGVFLFLMQGDKTMIGYFNRKKLKKDKKKKEIPRTKTVGEIAGLMGAKGFGVTGVSCYGFIAIFHQGYSRRAAGVIRSLFHKLLLTRPPPLYSCLFPFASTLSGRSMRKPHQLILPEAHIGKYINSFFYRSSLVWNTLPAAIQNITCNQKFKKEIEKNWSAHMHSTQFNSI